MESTRSPRQKAIVLDSGSLTCKAGFAGDDTPSVIYPTLVGTESECDEKRYYGKEAVSKQDHLKLSHPIEYGRISNWDDIEKIWHEIFFSELQVNPEDHAVALTEPPLGPNSPRERAAQLMFETFKVPFYHTSLGSILALYSTGSTSGIVVDSGYNTTYVIPVYEGYWLPHAVRRVDRGGSTVTEFLRKKLNDLGYSFHSPSQIDVVRQIKEQLCCVASDYDEQMKLSDDKMLEEKSFELPDGQRVVLGVERFQCTETMFQPSRLLDGSMQGLHDDIDKAISSCDVDIRDTLLNDMVLCGGNAMLSGFQERIKKEVQPSRPNIVINVKRRDDAKFASWIGGSILYSIDVYSNMWITKAEYDESGPQIVHRKCY